MDNEMALYETRVALGIMIRLVSRHHNKNNLNLSESEKEMLEGAKKILSKYFDVKDVLRIPKHQVL